MGTQRLNHMELTFGEGELTEDLRTEIRDFYTKVFGWNALDIEVVGQQALLLGVDEEVSQFILLAEHPEPIRAPGYDHLGVLLETRAEVDDMLRKCKAYQASDPRVRIKEYDDLDQGVVVVHAFYVKFLLPIWLDVQCMEWREGAEPKRRWTYA